MATFVYTDVNGAAHHLDILPDDISRELKRVSDDVGELLSFSIRVSDCYVGFDASLNNGVPVVVGFSSGDSVTERSFNSAANIAGTSAVYAHAPTRQKIQVLSNYTDKPTNNYGFAVIATTEAGRDIGAEFFPGNYTFTDLMDGIGGSPNDDEADADDVTMHIPDTMALICYVSATVGIIVRESVSFTGTVMRYKSFRIVQNSEYELKSANRHMVFPTLMVNAKGSGDALWNGYGYSLARNSSLTRLVPNAKTGRFDPAKWYNTVAVHGARAKLISTNNWLCVLASDAGTLLNGGDQDGPISGTMIGKDISGLVPTDIVGAGAAKGDVYLATFRKTKTFDNISSARMDDSGILRATNNAAIVAHMRDGQDIIVVNTSYTPDDPASVVSISAYPVVAGVVVPDTGNDNVKEQFTGIPDGSIWGMPYFVLFIILIVLLASVVVGLICIFKENESFDRPKMPRL